MPTTTLAAHLYETYFAFDWQRYGPGRARWVMNLDAYKKIRAETGPPDDKPPDEWVPGPDDRILGTLITVRDDGGDPHLELVT